MSSNAAPLPLSPRIQEALGEITLSICIPTYRRSRFLEQALEQLAAMELPFSHEIIVSDNASPDDTADVVARYIARGLPIRYFRCVENTGHLANHASALRLGCGEFLVYVADDDRLIREGLLEAVAVMQANPEIMACYAPWLIYDEINDQDLGQFYNVEHDFVLHQGNFAGAFDFITRGTVFPEMAVYRATAFRSASSYRYFAYWAFAHLAHYLDIGAVAFLRKPFYRSGANFRIHQSGLPSGYAETMSSWDRYRGGVEYLLYYGMKRGSIVMDEETRPHYEAAAKQFMFDRMLAAQRLWIVQNDYIPVYELYTRLVVAGYEDSPQLQNLRETLKSVAATHGLVRLLNTTAGIQQLVIANVTNGTELGHGLRHIGLREDIAIEVHSGDVPLPPPPNTVVFVRWPHDREPYLQGGYGQNLVLCEDDVMATVLI